tara:strand:+ start:3164 stop:4207 length:1044 start_codon:yes stop_codon:yes gene_type:complete
MKSIFLLFAMIVSSTSVLTDEMPFYFFALRIMNLPNVQETAKAEKELCSFITKNCELSKEKSLKFSIMKLHDGPNEKSKVVGAFVNALKDGCYGNDEEIDHCKASGKASFVVLVDGTRLALDHYLGATAEDMAEVKTLYRKGVGEESHAYLRYVRVVDAVPKTQSSFYKPVERWYGLASPAKNNEIVWFKYHSDLRNLELTFFSYDFNEQLDSLTCKHLSSKISPRVIKDLKMDYKKVSKLKGDKCFGIKFVICGADSKFFKVKILSYADYLNNFIPAYNRAENMKFSKMIQTVSIQKSRNISCSELPGDRLILIPVADYYENGFLKNKVWFDFLEHKRLFEIKVQY